MKTTIAARKTLRAPNLSAAQPDSGMKTASARRYDVSASLSATGSSLKSTAIAGSAVANTVPSKFSMNKAVATMSGVRNEKGKGGRSFEVEEKTRLARAGG